MNELMMDLFSSIADQVRNKQELFDNEGGIMQALLNDGYHLHDADAALTLMQALVQKGSEGFFSSTRAVPSVRVRAMNREERERFTVDAFGFVSKLTHLGIITEDEREELLEKALVAYSERIELDHIKNLVAFVLFARHHEQDYNASAGLRRIKRTAWN